MSSADTDICESMNLVTNNRQEDVITMVNTNRSPRIAFSFMSIGHYRREPMRLVVEHYGNDLQIFSGRFAVDRSIRTLGPSELPIVPLLTYSVANQLFIQLIPFMTYLRAAILVADLNPRVLHLWPVLLVRRILGRPTILWGAAWPRKGRDSKTTIIRLAMVRLASGVIIYTQQQARELLAVLPEASVVAAPNSLYRSSQCGFAVGSLRNTIVYVGRIVRDKKLALLLEAFAQVSLLFDDLFLSVVGDGPELEEMRNLADQLNLSQRVNFLGHVDDVEQLRSVYATCIASVSPGYVGLSATQSFSFGVPMIIADSEPHSPEIEAVKPGFNARYFSSNSSSSLATVMEQVVAEKREWARKGVAIADDCVQTYSAEAMASGIIQAVNSQMGNSCAVP